MHKVAERLRSLREGLDIPQKKVAEMLGASQSAINRYENGQAEAPFKILLWYADYFDVSLDYIFGRTDQPQGKLYNYDPDAMRRKFYNQEDWQEFIEACFAPNSPMNAKLKEMMLKMARGDEEK